MPEEVQVPDGGDGQVPPVTPPAPKKLAYTDEQQEHLNNLINDAYAKAFKKAKEMTEEVTAPKLKALEDQIAALKTVPPAPKEPVVPPPDPNVAEMKARLDEMEAVAKQLREEKDVSAREAAEQRQRGRRTRVKEEFIRASGNKEFFDPMDVFNLVQDQLELDDATDRVVIMNPNTKLPRQSVSGNMTIDEFLTDFAKAKPHMVRSKTAAGGTGSEEQRRLNPNDGTPAPTDYSKMSNADFLALADKVISDGYRKQG